MYKYDWDNETGGYILNLTIGGVSKDVRPVFFEELDMLGFDKLGWHYPKPEEPLLWAEGRKYIYKGETVAEVNGGSLYTVPTIKIFCDNLFLTPVDIQKMVEKNRHFMTGLVQSTTDAIYDTYLKYKNKVDVIYVAFSGGKDSLVLLDLVQRVLPHIDFKVVFADTTMEINETYEAVAQTKQRYPSLDFHTAKANLNATDSWKEFGIPSRSLRWCCAVHKSVPSILKLRELAGKENLKVLAYDGVRSDESIKRAAYIEEGDSGKHGSQLNLHPIAEWGSAEIFLYLFDNKLLLNKAYRKGVRRVGCALCPEAAEWWEYVAVNSFPESVHPFLSIVHEAFVEKLPNIRERQCYIDAGNWKSRFDARDIRNGGNKLTEQEFKDKYRFTIHTINCAWQDWIKPIGSFRSIDDFNFEIIHKSNKYSFSIDKQGDHIIIDFYKGTINKESIHFTSLLRKMCNKLAYCKQCNLCKVECRHGALDFIDGLIIINNKCTKCEKCYNIEQGCILTKSLTHVIGGSNMTIKGLGNYKHFGFRKEWLEYYFKYGDTLWTKDLLGKPKQDALKIFLRESEITHKHQLAELGQQLMKLGTVSSLTWAVILINLVYNSELFKFYINNTSFGITTDNDGFAQLFGEQYSNSTKDNAIRTLKETFRDSPIGSDLGLGVCVLNNTSVISVTREVWSEPSPLVVLYSLYKFAEKCEGYYSFTLSQLCNNSIARAGISPTQIFGLSYETLKEIIESLSADFNSFIRCSFSKNLDNIELNNKKTSVDVLTLF